MIYESISSQTLSNDASSVTFSNIGQNWQHLNLVVSTRTTYTGQNEDNLRIRFNDDSSSNYSITYLYGNGSSALSGRTTNETYLTTNAITGAPSDANLFSAANIYFINYSSTNKFKSILYSGGSVVISVIKNIGLWRSTAPINSISIFVQSGNNFKSDSTFSLYGIKKV